MELNELDDLIYGLGIETSEAHLDQIFEAYENDFVHDVLYIDGLKVKVIHKKSKVVGFEKYPETFVHLITRKGETGKRLFDKHRANKIHWIRCILEKRTDEEITFFQYPEDDGSLRDYYWYKEGNFLVIMEKIRPDYVIVTSFHIDNKRNKEYFERKEKWYRTNKK